MKTLGLDDNLVAALTVQNITFPTQIQRLAIPRILSGESLIVKSPTGSGKSLAYLLPMLQILTTRDLESQMLVLLPTRELAQQVGRVLESLGSSVSMAVIHGGVDYDLQKEVLSRNPRVIIATPGRLQDIISQDIIILNLIRYFILDEVDQMVDLGFRQPIVELSRLRVEGAQSLCFSATISELVGEVMGEFPIIEDESLPLAAQSIEQSGYFVEQSMMEHLLLHLLRSKNPSRAIIFCRSRKMADRLAELLRASSFAAEAIHSDRSQAARDYIFARFRGGETQLLVASDIVARGIDVEGVSHIFNFGLPLTPDQYIHRIGRTGRAGASGEAITLICPDEYNLLRGICGLMRQNIPINNTHPYMTPAVTRQLDEASSNAPKTKRTKKKGRR